MWLSESPLFTVYVELAGGAVDDDPAVTSEKSAGAELPSAEAELSAVTSGNPVLFVASSLLSKTPIIPPVAVGLALTRKTVRSAVSVPIWRACQFGLYHSRQRSRHGSYVCTILLSFRGQDILSGALTPF